MTWHQITCREREQLVDELGRSYNGLADPYGVISSRTDIGGQFGDPVIDTTWGHKETGEPVLRDVRWPAPPCSNPGVVLADVRPCEHYRHEADS